MKYISIKFNMYSNIVSLKCTYTKSILLLLSLLNDKLKHSVLEKCRSKGFSFPINNWCKFNKYSDIPILLH